MPETDSGVCPRLDPNCRKEAIATLARYNTKPFTTDFMDWFGMPRSKLARQMHDTISEAVRNSPSYVQGCTHPRAVQPFISPPPASVGAMAAPTCKDFVDYLDQIAMCGRQHIFLLSPFSNDQSLCRDLARSDFLEEVMVRALTPDLLSRKSWIQRIDSPAPSSDHSTHLNCRGVSLCLWNNGGPFLAQAMHILDDDDQPHWLSLKWVETRWYNKTKITPQGSDSERSVNFFLVNLTDGSAQLRLQLLRSRPVKSLQEEHDLYVKELTKLGLWENFTPVFLAPLIRRFLQKDILPITNTGVTSETGKLQVSKASQSVIRKILRPFSHFSPRPIRVYWQCHQRSHNDARLYFTLNGFDNSITFSGVTDRPRVDFITRELYQARGPQDDLGRIFMNELKQYASRFPDSSQIIYLIDYHFSELKKSGVSSTEIRHDTSVNQKTIEKVFYDLVEKYPNTFIVMPGVKSKVIRRLSLIHTIRMTELRDLARRFPNKRQMISVIDYRYTVKKKRGINSRTLASEEGFIESQVKDLFKEAAKIPALPPAGPNRMQRIWRKARDRYDRAMTYVGRQSPDRTPNKPMSPRQKPFDIITQDRHSILLLSRYTGDIKMKELSKVAADGGIAKKMIQVIDHEISELNQKKLHSGDFAELTGFSERSVQKCFRKVAENASSRFEADEEDDHVVLLLNGYASRIQNDELRSIAQDWPANAKTIYVIDYHIGFLKMSGLHSEEFARREGFEGERVKKVFDEIGKKVNGRFQVERDDRQNKKLLVKKHIDKKPMRSLRGLGTGVPEAEKMIGLVSYYFRRRHRIGLNSALFARETGLDNEKLKELFLEAGNLPEFTAVNVGGNVVLSVSRIVRDIRNRKLKRLAQNFIGDKAIIAAVDHEFGGILKMIFDTRFFGASLWFLVFRFLFVRKRRLHSAMLAFTAGYQEMRVADVFRTIAENIPTKYSVTRRNEHTILTRKSLFYDGWIDRPLRYLRKKIGVWLQKAIQNKTNPPIQLDLLGQRTPAWLTWLAKHLTPMARTAKIKCIRVTLNILKWLLQGSGVPFVIAAGYLVEQVADYLIEMIGLSGILRVPVELSKVLVPMVAGIQFYGWRRVEDKLVKIPMKGIDKAIELITRKPSDIRINAQTYEKWLRGLR